MTGKKEIVLPVETALTFIVAGGTGGRTAARAASRSEAPAARTESYASPGSSATGKRGSAMRQAGEAAQAPMFSDPDQQLIRRYFATQTANLPPGLAKRGGNLPPGLERQLERNGTLPPGLQKRIEPFPRDLSQQLPSLPAGYQRVVLGVRAIIIDRNKKILDLMFVR
jgi:hypothetical protein